MMMIQIHSQVRMRYTVSYVISQFISTFIAYICAESADAANESNSYLPHDTRMMTIASLFASACVRNQGNVQHWQLLRPIGGGVHPFPSIIIFIH